ncbi:carbamoyltransferase HypF [Paraburkholderia phenazinium]|uniref:Carbamoyltransferase HypF n=1 Tax=Paraburkholderia phenazinium TaxID=60549 RepID=A0A1G8B3K7_9BURK|nr:carbamoyltransferase HypF [Paraburkholderia phenazinium]SDH27220.1 Hydrogenase maturation protein, carbamoyltransferase HypF [Paraburkholderia phenazinium]
MSTSMHPPGGRSGSVRPVGEEIRVRGLVQGVGFRPTVWRLAHDCGLRGDVRNDSDGVLIHACGDVWTVEQFLARLQAECPPLARIDAIERHEWLSVAEMDDFRIVPSAGGPVQTGVVPDAVTCADCLAEIADPANRRYRYPFTNCTHCGPRLSIIDAIPYDRANTTMSAFAMCDACRAEYENPADRRFHAQPVACAVCGPRVWLEAPDGAPLETSSDACVAASVALQRGSIVAVKGLGGFQLACDACDEAAVARLRRLKRRERKPFALLARDLEVVRRYAPVDDVERALLQSAAGPIVILRTHDTSASAAADPLAPIAPSVAPGVGTLGFMLPSTPLHRLLVESFDRPLVLTSGNTSDEPQCIDNADARARLGRIADLFLMHDRDVARRVDDSVARVVFGAPRVVRRSRGYAPAPLMLPEGFEDTPAILAMGGELKNTFCLSRAAQAIVSHHMGDLEDALTYADYRRSVMQYLTLFEHEPQVVALDLHPEYLSRKIGCDLAQARQWPLEEVQHHHAHIASCMAENGLPIDAQPVLGVALDGLGYGADGTLWGGEFMLAGYRDFIRLGMFKPVAMPGGVRAIHEPWRNTYAHLLAAFGWETFAQRYAGLDLQRFFAARPRDMLDSMIAQGVNSPLASSAGRLFDAVAAATGLCRERVLYEGQAAVEFEALVDPLALSEEDDARAYPFGLARETQGGLRCLDPQPMWTALLDDLQRATPVPVIAARFHKGLAIAIVQMVELLVDELIQAGAARGSGAGMSPGDAPLVPLSLRAAAPDVALSGGVFQNRVLLEQVAARLVAAGLRVLSHRQVPANDGGLSLGQAVVAAARRRAP